MYNELREEYIRLEQLMKDRKTTESEDLAIQHIWAKVRELNNHFINKDMTREYNAIRKKSKN